MLEIEFLQYRDSGGLRKKIQAALIRIISPLDRLGELILTNIPVCDQSIAVLCFADGRGSYGAVCPMLREL